MSKPSYLDIKTSFDPPILFTLDLEGKFTVSAVRDIYDDTAVKLIIHDDNQNPIDTDGEIITTGSPYVANVVFSTADDPVRIIKSEMLKLADTIDTNIKENYSKGASGMDKWEVLKNSDPFDRGWSTNPEDAINTLEELGFVNIYSEKTGIVDPQDQVIHFEDEDGWEGEVFVNRVGKNTFQYNIVSQDYDDEVDDLYKPDIPDEMMESSDNLPDDEDSINKYLTLKYHFLDQGYNEKDADKLAHKNLDKDTVEECDLSEASISDQVVTIGIYGDYTGDYESLDSMVAAFKNAGIEVKDLEGDEDYGWEMNLTGRAKTLYKMVDDKIPGYSCDSVQEFVDEYSIEESTEEYDEEDDEYPYPAFPSDYEPEDGEYEFEEECNLNEETSTGKYYVLIGYNSYPESGIEADTFEPILVLGADNEAEAFEKCEWVKNHIENYPEAQGYDDISYLEVDADYIETYFGYEYLDDEPITESEHPEELDVKRHKVGDIVCATKEGMTDPDSYKVGDDIKIGALRGKVVAVNDDCIDLKITYNGFLDEDTDPSIGNKMVINVHAGINSDGFIITILDPDGKKIYDQRYDYGYNASYSREIADYSRKDHEDAIKYKWSSPNYYHAYKPYVTDIINDLCSQYNVDKSNIEVTNGQNVFAGKPVDDEKVNDFKSQYLESCEGDLCEDLEDDPDDADQEFSSADTSINSKKIPVLFSKVQFNPGTVNLDWGGGKFDNVTEYLADQDVTNYVYDKYNRTADHNRDVLQAIRQNGGADTVTCSNVLNVIKEPEARLAVIKNCRKYLKNGGKAYFTVYYASGKSEGQTGKDQYQLHRKTADYVSEIEQVFNNVTRKGNLIIAEGFDRVNDPILFDD